MDIAVSAGVGAFVSESGVVKGFGWLNDQQFTDAVGMAMITPGTVVITVRIVGSLMAGF